MKNFFNNYNINLSEKELELFKKLLDKFIETNSQVNLSAIRDEEWIIKKHFIDSIILNKYFKISNNAKVFDMWTGWWFPLIPLAITNPKAFFVWIDSVWKKLKAIEWFIKELWLKNVSTIHARAEDLWQNIKYRESFDIWVSRATAYMPILLEFCMPLIKTGWIFISYKLDDSKELLESKKALKEFWWVILKQEKYEIDWSKRSFIIIKKIKTLPKKYPRANWIPSKQPIK